VAEDFKVEWPALFVALDWVEHHCVIPDGGRQGERFEASDWQAWCLLNHYRVKPTATRGQLAPAFHYRRSQIVLPQKAGKAPFTSTQICLEGVGPALFAGWAGKNDEWRCSDHGCRCGWTYRYAKGEAMGRSWPTPLIQIAAFSDDQTGNIYDALRPMIQLGPLHRLIPKTGEEFIRLPGGGRIDTVTSSAQSRLGQRVTFVAQDETGIWTQTSGMVKVAETQRRGLAGMGGRASETTNGWDPTEQSVAQRTAEAAVDLGDVFRYHPLAPADLVYKVKADREKIHAIVYGGCPWVDLDSIEGEAAELIRTDAPQAERFFGNRIVEGAGHAFNAERWAELADPDGGPADGELIVVGVDGARFDDSIAVVATDVLTGWQWPPIIIERPKDAGADYEHDLEEVDRAMLDVFDRFDVWRAYIDPQHIGTLVDRWQGRWGQKIVEWFTYRERPISHAVKNYTIAQSVGDVHHNGDPVLERHIAAAVRRPVSVRDDEGKPLHTLQKPKDRRKIDGAMAGVLSWEARGDAIAAGAKPKSKHKAKVHSF